MNRKENYNNSDFYKWLFYSLSVIIISLFITIYIDPLHVYHLILRCFALHGQTFSSLYLAS